MPRNGQADKQTTGRTARDHQREGQREAPHQGQGGLAQSPYPPIDRVSGDLTKGCNGGTRGFQRGRNEAIPRKRGYSVAGHRQPEKASSKKHGERKIPATRTPWGKRARSRNRGEEERQAAETPRARKKELPATKTPQSKGERNRDHREKEDQRTETPGSFPLQRTQGERAHSNRGGPELQGEWRKKLTAAGRPQGKEERDRGQQEKEKYTSESHEIVQKKSLSRVRGDSSRSSQD